MTAATSTPERSCGSCGRIISKAHRVLNDKPYCGTCYKSLFRRAACTRCHRPTRVLRTDLQPAICPNCLLEPRLCVRCQRHVPRAGLVVSGRVVCPSCTPFFLPPKICPQCGRSASTLSRSPSHGIHQPVCPRCYRAATQKTCSVCRRSRTVAGTTADDRPYCAACAPERGASHACPDCGRLQVGDGQGRCLPCLNARRLAHNDQLLGASLEHAWTRSLFSAFSDWMLERQPSLPQLSQVNASHLPFFHRLEACFPAWEAISGSALLTHFPVTEQRRHLLPIRFLAERHGIVVPAQGKVDRSARDRITDLLLQIKQDPWFPLIRSYHEHLVAEQIQPRTIRMYVATAVAFCRHTRLAATAAVSTSDVQKFLRKHPGCRTNIFRWLSFGRSHWGWTATVPPRHTPAPATPRTVRDLSVHLDIIARTGPERAPWKILHQVMVRAFALPRSISALNNWHVSDAPAPHLAHGDEQFPIPNALIGIAHAWQARRPNP